MSDTPARAGAGKDLRRPALVALALPIALAVAACAGASSSSSAGVSASPSAAVSGSPSGDVAGATGSPSASVASSPTADDACSLITTDEAAQLVGSPVMATPATTPAGPSCRYTPTEAGAQGFLTISVFTSDVDKTLSDAVTNFGLGDVAEVGIDRRRRRRHDLCLDRHGRVRDRRRQRHVPADPAHRPDGPRQDGRRATGWHQRPGLAVGVGFARRPSPPRHPRRVQPAPDRLPFRRRRPRRRLAAPSPGGVPPAPRRISERRSLSRGRRPGVRRVARAARSRLPSRVRPRARQP